MLDLMCAAFSTNFFRFILFFEKVFKKEKPSGQDPFFPSMSDTPGVQDCVKKVYAWSKW